MDINGIGRNWIPNRSTAAIQPPDLLRTEGFPYQSTEPSLVCTTFPSFSFTHLPLGICCGCKKISNRISLIWICQTSCTNSYKLIDLIPISFVNWSKRKTFRILFQLNLKYLLLTCCLNISSCIGFAPSSNLNFLNIHYWKNNFNYYFLGGNWV